MQDWYEASRILGRLIIHLTSSNRDGRGSKGPVANYTYWFSCVCSTDTKIHIKRIAANIRPRPPFLTILQMQFCVALPHSTDIQPAVRYWTHLSALTYVYLQYPATTKTEEIDELLCSFLATTEQGRNAPKQI